METLLVQPPYFPLVLPLLSPTALAPLPPAQPHSATT
ncbi:hypothetical protein AX774_g7265, partial [Zancudomyces culisetae]